MRWAFWRRREEQPAEGQPVEVTSCWPVPSADEEEHDPARTAFSGARPSAPADLTPGAPRSPLDPAPPAALAAAVRPAIVELVGAITDRGATAVPDLLDRLDDAQLGAAAALAVAALGPRLATLAGHEGQDASPGSAAWRETVVQGDVTAGRAESAHRAVARGLPDGLLRFAVRFACGTPEADPALAHHATASPRELLLAAALVLAQTVEDGAGSVEALAGELQAVVDEL